MLSDILAAVNCGDVAALALLDLSAAFNRVEHDILIHRLQTSYGIIGMSYGGFDHIFVIASSPFDVEAPARTRLSSYVECHRGQRWGRYCSCSTLLILLPLFRSVDWSCNYTQTTHRSMGGRWSPLVRIGDLLEKFAACFGDIPGWMRSNRLQLNIDN